MLFPIASDVSTYLAKSRNAITVQRFQGQGYRILRIVDQCVSSLPATLLSIVCWRVYDDGCGSLFQNLPRATHESLPT